LPCSAGVFSFGGIKMIVNSGEFCFVSDSFFTSVNDPYLKINYPTTKRPHYLAVYDAITDFYWLVPCSSKISKYTNIILERKSKNKPTNIFCIIKIQNIDMALLFGDMFPVSSKFIASPYIKAGTVVKLSDPHKIAALEKNAHKIIKMLLRGVKFSPTQPDIRRIIEFLEKDI